MTAQAVSFMDGQRRVGVVAKRCLDLSLALVVLACSIPLFVLVAVLIKLDSPGPVLYKCRRVGLHGQAFSMLKFRKMRCDASGPAITAAADERFTRVGVWLARLKLDELPQLVNVVTGEMSLVGPRPEAEDFVALHRGAFRQILSVRPGITGLSQLAFARESSVLGTEAPLDVYVKRVLPQKVQIDVMYATTHSLRGDIRILFWTAIAVLARREVAVHRSTGQLSLRRRPSRASAVECA